MLVNVFFLPVAPLAPYPLHLPHPTLQTATEPDSKRAVGAGKKKKKRGRDRLQYMLIKHIGMPNVVPSCCPWYIIFYSKIL